MTIPLKPLVIPVAMAIFTMAAQAQTPDGSDESDKDWALEEVLVTATKRETSLMITPVAITAFDQKTMDRQNVKNIKDIATLVPSLDISQENGQTAPVIAMRGVRSTNNTELGDPAVGIHLDGVYSPRMQGALAMTFDSERVEVMRGPQGTLYGRNSTVGAINIISAKPNLDELEGNINMELGRWNAKSMHGMVNIPINDTLAVRIAGKFHTRDSYLTGYYDPNQYDQRYLPEGVTEAPVIAEDSWGEGDTRTQHSNWWIDWVDGGSDVRALVRADPTDFYGNINEWSLRAALRWQPTDAITFDTNIQRFVNNSAGGVDLVNCDQLRGRPDGNGGRDDCSRIFPDDNSYQAVVNIPGDLRVQVDYLRGNLDVAFSEYAKFVWNFGYEDQQRKTDIDMDISLNAWDGAMFFLDGTGSKSYSHEIQFQSIGTDNYTWIVGANIFHEKTTTLGFYDNAPDDKAFWDMPNRSGDAVALFSQGTVKLTDNLELVLGARYSEEKKEDVGGQTYVCNNTDPDPDDDAIDMCGVGWWNRSALNALPADYFEDPAVYNSDPFNNDNRAEFSNTSYRIGLNFDLNADTFLYTSFATGFKAGGIGDVIQYQDYVANTENPDPYQQSDFDAFTDEVKTSFDQETVATLEFGVKSTLLDDTLNITAAYYFSDYKDMQYAQPGAIANPLQWKPEQDEDDRIIIDDEGNPVYKMQREPQIAYYTRNVPGAEIQGLELEFDWAPYPNGRIAGFATWTKTEIVDDWITKWDYDPVYLFGIEYEQAVDPTNEILQVNLKGNELAVTPEYEFTINYEHTFNLPNGSQIKPFMNLHWESASYLTIWNVDKHTDDLDFAVADENIKYSDDRRPSYATLDATLNYSNADGIWYAEAFVYNITNEVIQYWSNAKENVAKGSLSTPRYYGVRFGYNF